MTHTTDGDPDSVATTQHLTSAFPPRSRSLLGIDAARIELFQRTAANNEWPHRILDLAFVVLMLPGVLLLLIFLSLIIKLNDVSAPVFFVQTRYGRHGRPFPMFKLRTMLPHSEARKAELLDLSACSGAGFKVTDDPRITRPGRWLRKLYLDELPQILNVLRGDMSFVGPRANSYPPETYEPWQLQRLDVKPGITGSWQVMANKPRDFATRCHIDIAYVRTRTLKGDLRILWQTFWVSLLSRTGE